MIDWDKPIEVYDSADEDISNAELITPTGFDKKVVRWREDEDCHYMYDVFNDDGSHVLDIENSKSGISWLTVRNVEKKTNEKKTNNTEKIKDLVLQLVELLPDDE